MDWMKVLISVFELLLTAAMAVLVVYVTMRAMIRANTDFDEDAEILKGNLSVGILVASLLLASAMIMHQAFSPVAHTIHVYLNHSLAGDVKHWHVAAYALGNLVFAFAVVVATLSFSLRLFGRLTRTEKTRPGKELEKGNVAVGILLACVVLIVAMFVGEGVNAISRALIPNPAVGHMRVMR